MTDHLAKSGIARASLWAMAGSGLQYLSLFILLAYLTRLLSPLDFGLMATLSIGLDLGLRVARWGQIELLQRPENRSDAVRNHAFWMTVTLACAPALMFTLVAWPIGSYFESPDLTIMAYLCAPVILLGAIGSTAEAILRNEMRFRQLAYRNTVCTLIAGVIAVAMASEGFGAVALAAQQLIQALLGTIWAWAAIRWRPRFFRASLYRPLTARHGATIMVGSLLPQLIPRSFDLFVALSLGPVALGIIRVANRFNDFVVQLISIPLNGVAIAHLSAIANDPAAVRRAFLGLTQASAAVMCPVMVGVGLVAPEAVPLLFGEQWLPSVRIVEILAVLGVILPASHYFSAAMTAIGRTDVVLRQSKLDLAVGVLAAIVAAGVSLEMVAWAVVGRCAFTAFCNAADLCRYLSLRRPTFARHLVAPYVATFIMAISVIGARRVVGDSFAPIELLGLLTIVGAVVYGAVMFAGLRLLHWPFDRAAIRQVLPDPNRSLYDGG